MHTVNWIIISSYFLPFPLPFLQFHSSLPFLLSIFLPPDCTIIKQCNLIEHNKFHYVGTKKFKTHQHSTIADRVFLAQKYHKIFHFFCGANGSLDVIDGVLTLLALALSREKNGGREDRGGEYGDRKKRVPKERCSNLTAADVAAVMAVVRGPQQRLILHERYIQMIRNS